MEQNEVLSRVVGILTQTLELSRLVEGGAGREDLSPGFEILREFVSDVLRGRVVLPHDASPQEIADAAFEQADIAANQLVYALALAFVRLAEYHDAGTTDVSSIDVLRELAAFANAPGSEQD
jgi:hypothetical protein